LHHGRRPAATLRKGGGNADQKHQCHRQNGFMHPVSPIFFNLINRVRSGTSIVAQFRRPWAAQSFAFRTSAMVPSSQIPAATSTMKKPAITAFSMLRLPSSGGSGCLPPSVMSIAADRDGFHRNNRRRDNAFPQDYHVAASLAATNSSARLAPC